MSCRSSPPPGFSWWKHRLYLAQQVLSENLNVPLRCLRGDAIEALKGVLRRRVYAEVLELVHHPTRKDLMKEELPRHVVSALNPEDQAQRNRVSLAIWLTPRSAPNPFYDELKSNIPQIRALLRLNILRKLRWLKNSPSGPAKRPSLELQPGLLSYFHSLPPRRWGGQEHILITGPARILRDEEGEFPSDPPRFLTLEKRAREAALEAGRIRHEELSAEEQTNLLILSTAYMEPERRTLELKAETASRVLRQVSSLEGKYEGFLESLSTSEFCRVVQWLFFWHSGSAPSSLNNYVSSLFEDRDSDSNQLKSPSVVCVVEDSLSGRQTRDGQQLAIRNAVRVGPTSRVDLDDLSFEIVQTDIAESPDHLRVNFEVDGSPPGVASLIEKVEESLRYLYHRTREASHSSRAHQEYLSFDRLRYILQHLEFDEVEGRQKELTRSVRRLVGADVAAYFSFDSLNGSLVIAAVDTAPWIGSRRERFLNQWLQDVAQNPRRRKQSVLYRCIDKRTFQSRVKIDDESHPWGTAFLHEVEQLPADRTAWGLDAEDVMAAPVQFHDRPQGVLYLVAGTPRRFRYYDRVRVLTFVQAFEAGLFRARLFLALRKINEHLGEALRQRIREGEFFNALMGQLGGLLAASGAILWWEDPSDPRRFRVLGFAGRELVGKVRQHSTAASGEFPFSSFTHQVNRIPLTFLARNAMSLGGIRELPWMGYTCLPLPDLENKRIVGALTLHGENPIAVPRYLEDHFRFVRDALRQTLEAYMAHRERIGRMTAMIGHEVQSALEAIHGRSRRLAALAKQGHGGSSREFELTLADLDRNLADARSYLDYLTMSREQWTQRHADKAAFFWPYRLEKRSLSEPMHLHEAVMRALHGRAQDLRRRGITFDFDGKRPPPMWLDPKEVDQVFRNLVDNLVKYGMFSQRLIVAYERDEVEFSVKLRGHGLPLRNETLESPEEIFEEGVRGLPPDSAERLQRGDQPGGTGQGLFVAREIARLWDGELSLTYVHGEPWSEYEFTVSFPRWLSAEANPWPERQ